MLKRRGFTLIELLVVITIIVVLLAMLAPALDQAIYQAELAACGSNLHGIGGGTLTYALENRRSFPERDLQNTKYRVANLVAEEPSGYDLRASLEGYITPNLFADPASPRIDLSPAATGPNAVAFGNYLLWFGYPYFGEKVMRRLGDGFTTGVGREFSVMAADLDSFSTTLNNAYNSHVDYERRSSSFRFQAADTGPTNTASPNARITESRWGFARTADPARMRPPIDRNVLWQDGAVARDVAVAWDDHETGTSATAPIEIFKRVATTDYWQIPGR